MILQKIVPYVTILLFKIIDFVRWRSARKYRKTDGLVRNNFGDPIGRHLVEFLLTLTSLLFWRCIKNINISSPHSIPN